MASAVAEGKQASQSHTVTASQHATTGKALRTALSNFATCMHGELAA